jgi:hypothetical protein
VRNFINNLFRFSTVCIAVIGFFSPMNTPASAETLSGLSVVGYEISTNAPPMVDSENPNCSAQYASINDWPNIYMAGCRTDQVMLHYSGYITIPTQTVQFRIWSDDGGWATIGDNSFGYWGLRGCSYTESPVYEFTAGQSVPIDAWFYEWGGGECFILWWNIGEGWGPVPESAFTQSAPETTTTTTTTTIPKFLGKPQNVSITNSESGVVVSWDPADDNTEISPERYAISWSNGQSGWGVATGNVGDENALNTQITLGYQLFESTGGLDTEYTFAVRADNDTQGIYSQESDAVQFTVTPPPPPTTTTTTTEPPTTATEPETTTTEAPVVTEPETTTTTEPEVIPPVAIPPDTEPPIIIPEPEITIPEPETTEPEIIIPEPETTEPEPETTDPEEVSDQVDEILSGDLTEEEFANAVDEILTSADNEEELVAAATELLSGDLSAEQFTEVIDQVFAEELSDEAFAEVLDTVFEEPLSDEEFTAVIDAVLDQSLSDEQFESLVDVLSSDTVTDEQVQEAVDAIIENGITGDQAAEIATSAEVLSSINGDQAAEIFAEVPIDQITEEQALEIIAAVQEAPTEVRSAFEEEINIFGSGSLNTYVPLGSSINVGQRRAVIAAGAVIAVAPVAGAPRRR